MADYKLLINGELVNSRSGKTVQDIGPASGEPVARLAVPAVGGVGSGGGVVTTGRAAMGMTADAAGPLGGV